jgi:hypothetical protein
MVKMALSCLHEKLLFRTKSVFLNKTTGGVFGKRFYANGIYTIQSIGYRREAQGGEQRRESRNLFGVTKKV